MQEDVVRKVEASDYEITLSEVYQVGQQFDVAKCKGTLRMEVPGEAYSTAETSYTAIKTQDGKRIVRSDGFNSQNEYNVSVLFGTLIQYMINQASR